MLPPGVKGAIGTDMMGHGEVEGPPGYGGGGKMSGGGGGAPYYKDMPYSGKEMSYPGRPKY